MPIRNMQDVRAMVLDVCLFVILRSLLFIVLLAGRARYSGRACAILGSWVALCLFVVFLGETTSFANALQGVSLVYLVLTTETVVAYGLVCLYRGAWLGGPALFVGLVAVFSALPVVVFPSRHAATASVLGMEMAFSALSFALDAPRRRVGEEWRGYLFFVLVNPVLVYPERGQRTEVPPRSVSWTLLRVASATATYAAYVVMADVVADRTYWEAVRVASGLALWTPVYVYLLAWGISMYLSHAALAGIAVAMMNELGWKVTERYRWPLFATSPQEFWQRWNLYIGAWLRRYVFFPVARALSRRRALSLRLAQAIALMCTFVTIGLLHDLSRAMQQGRPVAPALTAYFAAHGAVLLCWLGLQRRVVPTKEGKVSPWALSLRWGAIHGLLIVCCYVSLPLLAGEDIPITVGELLGF